MSFPTAGRLAERPFYRVLRDVIQHKATGSLTVQGESDTIVLTFDLGMCVHAESHYPRPEIRLGQLILKRGFIDENQLDELLREQKQNLLKLGYIAREHGLINPLQLMDVLEDQMMLIMYPCFNWISGLFHFRMEDSVHYDKDSARPIDLNDYSELGDTILKHSNWMEQRLETMEIVPSLNVLIEVLPPGVQIDETQNDDNAPVVLTPEQDIVYNLVNGVFSVREIIDTCHQFEYFTRRALLDLEDLGVIIFPEQKVQKSRYKFELGQLTDFAVKYSKFLLAGSAVIALLIVIRFIPLIVPQKSELNQVRVQYEMQSFRTMNRIRYGLEVFHLLNKRYPKFLQELVENKLLDDEDLIDGWNSKIYYRSKDNGYVLVSEGQDRVWSTSDDFKYTSDSAEYENISFFPSWNSANE